MLQGEFCDRGMHFKFKSRRGDSYDETVVDRSCFFAASFAAPGIGHAQTFKVQKFDIKGDGGTDYITAEAGTGRVFVSRGTHMMVVEGATGKVLGDILNTPGVHGTGDRPSDPATVLRRMVAT